MLRKVNRRRWERHPFHVSVRVVVDDIADRGVVDGRGVRLSEGGICLFALANLAVGTEVKIEFPTQRSEEPVRIRGAVRNRAVYLYGVEFLHDGAEDRRQVAQLNALLRPGNRVPSA